MRRGIRREVGVYSAGPDPPVSEATRREGSCYLAGPDPLIRSLNHLQTSRQLSDPSLKKKFLQWCLAAAIPAEREDPARRSGKPEAVTRTVMEKWVYALKHRDFYTSFIQTKCRPLLKAQASDKMSDTAKRNLKADKVRAEKLKGEFINAFHEGHGGILSKIAKYKLSSVPPSPEEQKTNEGLRWIETKIIGTRKMEKEGRARPHPDVIERTFWRDTEARLQDLKKKEETPLGHLHPEDVPSGEPMAMNRSQWILPKKLRHGLMYFEKKTSEGYSSHVIFNGKVVLVGMWISM